MRDSQHLSGSDFSVTAYSSGLITGTDNILYMESVVYNSKITEVSDGKSSKTFSG